MIFDNIRRKVFSILLFALLILLLLYAKDLFCDIPDETDRDNSIFAGLTDILSKRLTATISILLALINGILIYKINFDHLSVTGREHLLVWLWIVQTGGFSFLHSSLEIHFATVFILLSYDALFNIYRHTDNYAKVFLSSMYLGTASLFYSFAVYLFIPYFVSLYRFKIAEFRDWIISIAGFLVPFYFAIFVFHFSTDDWLYPVETTINNIIPDSLSAKIVEMSITQYIFCAFIAILVVAGILIPIKSTNRGPNQKTISCMRSFSTLMVFAILIFLFFTPGSRLMLQIIFIATTIYLRILFVKINKDIIANSLFISLIVASTIALLIEN
jgi:hypothetical protein